MVKEVLYKVEDGELRNRENLFDSNISSYTVYDKNGKIIENGRYEKDGSLYEKTFYERNENGDSQKGLKKNSSEELKSQWTYEYDVSNNLTKVRTYNSENILTNTQSNKLDKNGNNIEMLLIDHSRNSIWKYTYVYNDLGEKIEQFRYKPDGILKDRRTYKYNNKGDEFEQYKFNADGSYTKFVSEYDEMNNLIIQNWFNEKDEPTHQTSFEYVYDKIGNWITKKRSSNGVLSMVWERQIKYYE